MSVLKTVAKFQSRRVLKLLYEKGELHFGDILRELSISRSSLSNTLKELKNCGLITVRKIKEDQRLPKTYYKLTEKGKKALIFYKLEEEFENLKDD